jgi:hypothetical protein
MDMLRVITETEVNGILSEKQTGPQLVRKLPAFYGTRKFITTFNNPATCPYLETDKSSSCPITLHGGPF